MARNNARGGRRRRVLNEEVLSANNITAYHGSAQADFEPGDTPRYGAGANIENHPQVTSFVPRRYRSLAYIALLGVGIGAFAEVMAHYADAISDFVKVVTPAEITNVFANRLVAWTSALTLLMAACATRLIFSLRRHRVDDDRGRYRVWRLAGWAAVALSLNAVVGGHELIARCLGSVVDYQLLPASAGWWLIPAALIGGWLLVKLAIDASECRSALAMYLLAIGCLATAGVHSAGWSPEWAAAWPETLSRALPLAGHILLLVGSLLFARYVVLDVQGLVEHKAPVVATAAVEEKQTASSFEAYEPETKAPEEESQWVDGSTPESDWDEEEPARKLSKAERKRLRKQKNRNRAA